jgi:AP endonuclease-2
MNPPDRLPLPPQLETLRDEERMEPEPPAFATKWWNEFSGKQRSLMSFFGKKGTAEPAGKGTGKVAKEPRKRERSGSDLKDDAVGSRLSLRPIEANEKADDGLSPSLMMVDEDSLHIASAPTIDLTDTPIEVSSSPIEPTFSTPTRKPIKVRPLEPSNNNKAQIKSSKKQEVGKGKVKEKDVTSQTTLVSFFRQPTVSPIASTSARKKGKRPEISPEMKRRTHIRSESLSSALNSCPIEIDGDDESNEAASTTAPKRKRRKIEGTDDRDQTEEDEVTAAALAQEEEPTAPAEQDQAGVVKTWGNIFAKKVPPKCIVHRVPCKSFGKCGR